MTPFPGPQSILVMDNTRIHHAQDIEDLVTAYSSVPYLSPILCTDNKLVDPGCRIEYLPPYSPDYNPIEQAFSVIKAHLRCNGITFFESHALYYELYRACNVITPEMMWGFFLHSGYL
jgi:transposase